MDDYLFWLLRASLVLSLSTVVAWSMMSWNPLHHPRWYRIAWALVLLQGVVFFPWSMQVTLPAMPLAIQQPNLPVVEMSSDLSRLNTTPPILLPEKTALEIPRAASESRNRRDESISLWNASLPLLKDESRYASEQLVTTPTQTSPVTATQLPSYLPDLSTRFTQWNEMLYSELATWPWYHGLVALWIAGLLSFLMYLVSNYMQLGRTLRAAKNARPKWSRELQQISVELNIRERVRLLVHREVGPFLCWTPRGYQIVVPVGLWNQLSEAERLAVLHHELCHLRRSDLWKALAARIIVALHWFNPLAWIAAQRFDESAEWACDNQLAREAPERVTHLAQALLSATENQQTTATSLALSVTGGPTFQRIHRLISIPTAQDTWMKRTYWIASLLIILGVGGIRLQLHPNEAAAQEIINPTPAPKQPSPEQPSTAIPDVQEPNTEQLESEPVNLREDEQTFAENDDVNIQTEDDSLEELDNYLGRIVVGDNETLKQFVTLLHSPTGRLLIKDRAAIAAQESATDINPEIVWQSFIEKNFEQADDQWTVRPDTKTEWESYVAKVAISKAEIEDISQVFADIAANLEAKDDTAEVLKRLLQHEAAPAYVYYTELRNRLHPGREQIEERLQEFLVRSKEGQYVIRPARRAQVEKRLQLLESLNGPLSRLEKELIAWSDDIAKIDTTHTQFADTLRSAPFAKFLLIQRIQEDLSIDDPNLDGFFGMLEDATHDTAKGLTLDLESDSYRELNQGMERFHKIWDYRDALAEPLEQISSKINNSDPLHESLRTSLNSDVSLLSIAVNMDYLPVTAIEATQEWIAQIVTKNDMGKYEITIPSSEEFQARVEDFYRQYRETRRRGRIVDDFAAHVTDTAVTEALSSIVGKLILTDMVTASLQRPDVDGLQIWFSNHFSESEQGLQLNDGADEVIQQFLDEAKEMDSELSKEDF
jgi:beta-lactamase regulating signal transducer with metallopeptidase domain